MDFEIDPRDELLRTGAWARYLPEVPTEFINRAKFYIETLEDYVSSQEKEEIAALELGGADMLHDYPYWWDDIFRENLRVTFLSVVCGYAEHAVGELCSASVLVAESRQWRKPGHAIIESNRKKLVSLGFKRPPRDVWSALQQIYKVRNSFLHNSGQLWHSKEADQNSIRKLVKMNIGLREQNDQLKLSDKFAVYILSVIGDVFEPLTSEFRGLCDRAS